jgi:endoglucanase Acf2
MVKSLISKLKNIKRKAKKASVKSKSKMKSNIKGALIGGAIALASFMPMKNSYAGEMVDQSYYNNSFSQPVQTTKYYGSGAVNLDNNINQQDLILIKNGTKND